MLQFDGGFLQRGAGLFPGLIDEIQKLYRIPRSRQGNSRYVDALKYLERVRLDRSKDGMLPNSLKPIVRIPGVRLLPMNDGMPEIAFRRSQVLCNFVRLIPAPEKEHQPGFCRR